MQQKTLEKVKRGVTVLGCLGICAYPFALYAKENQTEVLQVTSKSDTCRIASSERLDIYSRGYSQRKKAFEEDWKQMFEKSKEDEENRLKEEAEKQFQKQQEIKDEDIKQTASLEQNSVHQSAIGNVDPMQDGIWIGDSRVEGFSAYGYDAENMNFGVSGSTVLDVDTHLEQIQNSSCKNVFVSYGVNDVISCLGEGNANVYTEIFEKKMDKILAVKPDAKLYINSIIPVTPEYAKTQPSTHWIPHYNEALKEMCNRRGWTFIDNDSWTNNGFADVYEPDGVHLKASTYKLWIANIVG